MEINNNGELSNIDVEQLHIRHMNIHTECAHLCVASQGGYQFNNVYFRMPSYLRKLHLQIVDKMTKTDDDDNSTNVPNSKKSMQVPKFAMNSKPPAPPAPPPQSSAIQKSIPSNITKQKLTKYKK